MKKTQILYHSFIALSFSFLLMSFVADEPMTKENGTYVINTTQLGKDIEGYAGPTPLKVYVKNNKVEKIEFLKSPETPKYYVKVKKALQEKWNRCRHRSHLQFRGRHQERPDSARLLPKSQIVRELTH